MYPELNGRHVSSKHAIQCDAMQTHMYRGNMAIDKLDGSIIFNKIFIHP